MPACPPPIRVNLTRRGLALDEPALAAALARLPAGQPVVVMIHGYRFTPGQHRHCPHRHILSINPPPSDRKAISWPRHLGLDGERGLAIAFGWAARGSVRGAYWRARAAGRALAELASRIARLAPGRQIDVIGHSLGARVALAALPHAAPGVFRKLILLAAAETRGPARAAMNSAAGQTVQVINVTTRENDLFDFLLEWLARFGLDTAIGQGLGRALPNWLDLQIDQPETLAVLGRLGHALPPPPARICHWSPYLRPGVFGLYRALLDDTLSPAVLRPLLPARRDPRWSRLLNPARGLPFLASTA